MSTERNYNLEFCKGLLNHPRVKEGEELRLFDLLVVAERIVGEEAYLVEEAMLETVEAYEVRELSEEEQEHLKQLLENSKEKHTTKVLSTVERVARAFNSSADESRIQTVIENAVKTSKLTKPAQQNEVSNSPEPLEKEEVVEPPKVEVEVVPQAVANPVMKPDMETLKQYLTLGVKLIPVHDKGAYIQAGEPRSWGTDSIDELQSLVNGDGYRNSIGKGSKISLFRFFPGDYGLVVVDIDRHIKEERSGKDGLQNWLKTEAELDLPQDCKLRTHTCCVSTTSGGYHLYYRTEGEVEFKPELVAAVDILHTKTVNAAGSVKEGKGYRLSGSLDMIPNLPEALRKRMLKGSVRTVPQPIKRRNIPYSKNKRLSYEERDAYKPYLKEYLELSGYHINSRGITNCPFPEHHNNGDKNPSAKVNQDFLYCFTAEKGYDIWDVATKDNGSFQAAVYDVRNKFKEDQI